MHKIKCYLLVCLILQRHNLAVNQADIADPTQRKSSLSTKSVCSMNSQYSLTVPGDEASGMDNNNNNCLTHQI